LRFNLEGVIRFYRSRPTQLIHSEPNRALSKVQRLNKKPHRDRRRMPPTRDQALEYCLTRDGAIQMNRLRIKLPREGSDLFFANFVCRGFEPLASFEILEIPLFHCRLAQHSSSIFHMRAKKNALLCLTDHCSLITYHIFEGAVSSVVEHLVYTERVGGSKPSPPSLRSQRGGERRLSRRSPATAGRKEDLFHLATSTRRASTRRANQK